MNTDEDASVGQLTYQRIRTDIIFADLAPDQRLKLDPLKVKYDTSVTTLREVLNRLVSEGFVIAEGQKGFKVSGISREGLREVAALRLLLERDALQRSIAQGDLDWEGGIVSAHHKLATMEEKMIAGEPINMRQWRTFDREFHTALISATRSTFFLKLYNDIFDHFLRYQMIAMGFRGRPAAAEHLAIMKHALARRPAEAVAVLTDHIELGVQEAITKGPLASAG